MKIHMVEQASQEWHNLRRGIPTASEFGRILPPKSRKPGKGADTYIRELIGATLSLYYPERAESFTNRNLEWGRDTETEARKWFAMEQDVDVKQVGFCTTDDGRFGCSPDGLLYDADNPDADPYPVAGLELKCPTEKIQAGYLLDGPMVPREYIAQVNGGMVVTGLPCWFFLSYCPGLPPLLVRVEPDEYTAALAKELERFWKRYQAALTKVREFGNEPSNGELLRASIDQKLKELPR